MEKNLEICEWCGRIEEDHNWGGRCYDTSFRPAPSQEKWDSKEGQTHYEHDGCGEPAHNTPQKEKESTEVQDEKIARIIKEFREKFPLLRVYPKVGQEIERFCDEEIEAWLTQTLTTLLNEE
jgi:hypothetical protein